MATLNFLLLSSLLLTADPIEADFVLRGATLLDGSSAAATMGDLAIKGDRIVGVGQFTVRGRPRMIDATGLTIAPGFIDLHTHSDSALQQPGTRNNLNYLKQGVTTVVTGNCGSGPIDVAAYYRTLEKGGIGSNVLHQMPHNDVRRAVLKNADRAPGVDELRQMEQLIDKGMKDGAWGLSTGLIYTPGTYAQSDELISLARIVAKHGGFYASHIRDEGTGLLPALEEALTIGREAKLPVHISHLKSSGRASWGKAGDAIALLERARRNGMVVTADQYPYTASSTSLAATVIPARFRSGERKEYLERLNDAEQVRQLRAILVERLAAEKSSEIRIASCAARPAWNGKDLESLARAEKKEAADIVLQIERLGGAQVINFGMKEEDVRLIMKQPWVATASDGGAMLPTPGQMPHPRLFGCFARKVGRYAIEDGIVTLPEAIRSATGLPADILHLPERGYLKSGYFADVVVFDPQKFRDQATYEQPQRYAEGVRYLFVNGRLAIDDGKTTNVLAGKVLRHESKQ